MPAAVEPVSSAQKAALGTFNKGLTAAVLGYCIWGLFPLYFKLLKSVPALEVLAHRVVWSFLLLLVIVSYKGMLAGFFKALRTPASLASLSLSTVLITLNWGLFIYAVEIGQTKSASLGYYINPFVNVALGMFFLGERLAVLQKIALGFAAFGVGWLVMHQNEIPWISLALAFSFGFYGLVRKKSAVKPLLGLTVETALMTPLALIYAITLASAGNLAFGAVGPMETSLLLCAGLLTTVPLLLFTFGAQTIPYSMMGFIQFITPTLHLVCALAVFGETITHHELISFILIWVGLGFFVAQLFVSTRKLPNKKSLQKR